MTRACCVESVHRWLPFAFRKNNERRSTAAGTDGCRRRLELRGLFEQRVNALRGYVNPSNNQRWCSVNR